MFLEYFNLLEQPFGVTPDTRFLYLNHMYREALASLWYGVKEGRGFMGLIADPGMGKTTLLFQLLQRLRSSSARTVFLFQTCCDSSDLIRYLLQDLGISPASDLPSMHHQLNGALVREARAGRQFVLVIDEAQNLSEPVLESIRLLSDFETSQGKLLQIILAGQRQLIGTLMKPDMLQLTQRISMANFLDPLDAEETIQYVSHRLEVAGYQGSALFTTDALQLIAEESGGIPRNVNNICFGALSTAFAMGRKNIDRTIIEEVAGDQSLRSLERRKKVSLRPTTQPANGSVFDTETKPAPRPTLPNIVPLSSWSKYVRGAACVLIFLMAATSKVAISTRSNPSIEVVAGSKTNAASLAPLLKGASITQRPPAAEVSQPTQNPGYVISQGSGCNCRVRKTLRRIRLRRSKHHRLRFVQRIKGSNPRLGLSHMEVGRRILLSRQNSTDVLRDEHQLESIDRSLGGQK